jgi:hypothetical protein
VLARGVLSALSSHINFIFFGDDTTSAEGSNEVSNLTLTPEPASLMLCAACAVAGLLRRRR